MKETLKIVSILIIAFSLLILPSCSDKSNRPWKISEGTIRDIVKAKLGCSEINVIVENVGTPQTACDQLGDCTDYADVKLSIEGPCKGRIMKLSGVFRLYRSKLGDYRGEMMEAERSAD